jgi:hypothetical protein
MRRKRQKVVVVDDAKEKRDDGWQEKAVASLKARLANERRPLRREHLQRTLESLAIAETLRQDQVLEALASDSQVGYKSWAQHGVQVYWWATSASERQADDKALEKEKERAIVDDEKEKENVVVVVKSLPMRRRRGLKRATRQFSAPSRRPVGGTTALRRLIVERKREIAAMQDRRRVTLHTMRSTDDGEHVKELREKWLDASQRILSELQTFAQRSSVPITLTDVAQQMKIPPEMLRLDPDDPDAFI